MWVSLRRKPSTAVLAEVAVRRTPNNRLLLIVLAVLLASAASCRETKPLPAEKSAKPKSWLDQYLSADEAATLKQLAAEIAQGPNEPAKAQEALRDKVRTLSIRQAAGLGTLLLDKYKRDPRPWLKLAQQREMQGIEQLIQVQRRVGLSESGYEPIQKTVRGPGRLREYPLQSSYRFPPGSDPGVGETFQERAVAVESGNDPDADT